MKLQRDLILPLLSCLVLACPSAGDEDGGSADETASTDDPGDGDGDAGDGDGDATDTSTIPGDGDGDPPPPDPVAMITGLVTDAAGAPLPDAGVQFCGPINDAGDVELCLPIPVADDGSFEIGAMTAALWNLKVVHGPIGDRKFAGQAFQVTVVDGEDMDFSAPPIVVPEATVTDLTGAMGEMAVAIDDVLTVNIDPAMATSPDFQPPTELGGLMVPMEHWRHTQIDGGTIIASWSFTPFGVKSMDGTSFTFTIDDPLGLAADDTVSFYEIEKDNAELHQIGSGVVNMDATAIDVTPLGNGFHELSWLFVVQ